MGEIRTPREKVKIGDRSRMNGIPVSEIRSHKKTDFISTLEFAEGVYGESVERIIICCRSGEMFVEKQMEDMA